MDEANLVLYQFLPDYNRKFAVTAKNPEVAYRKIEQEFKADEFFCFKYGRIVGRDNVVRFKRQRLQVLPTLDRLSYALCKVEVQVRLDGSPAIYYQNKPLDIETAPLEATLMRKSALIQAAVGMPVKKITNTALSHKPALDHPWRGKFRTHFD